MGTVSAPSPPPPRPLSSAVIVMLCGCFCLFVSENSTVSLDGLPVPVHQLMHYNTFIIINDSCFIIIMLCPSCQHVGLHRCSPSSPSFDEQFSFVKCKIKCRNGLDLVQIGTGQARWSASVSSLRYRLNGLSLHCFSLAVLSIPCWTVKTISVGSGNFGKEKAVFVHVIRGQGLLCIVHTCAVEGQVSLRATPMCKGLETCWQGRHVSSSSLSMKRESNAAESNGEL